MTKLKIAAMKLPSWERPYFVKKALQSWKGLRPKSKRLMAILIPTILVATFLLILFKNQLALWAKRYQIGLAPQPSPTTTLEPKTAASPTPTPRGTPTPLKKGKETYYISQSSSVKGPKITQVTLDPLDPKNGEKQTITVKALHSGPVTQVKISLMSDNKTQTLSSLSLVSGTNLEGEWQVSWTVDDTILYKYILKITATGGGVQSSVDLAIRS